MAWPTVTLSNIVSPDPELDIAGANFVLNAFVVEGTYREPTTGQIWPR